MNKADWAAFALKGHGFDSTAAECNSFLARFTTTKVDKPLLDIIRKTVQEGDPTKKFRLKADLRNVDASILLSTPEGRRAVRKRLAQLELKELREVLGLD